MSELLVKLVPDDITSLWELYGGRAWVTWRLLQLKPELRTTLRVFLCDINADRVRDLEQRFPATEYPLVTIRRCTADEFKTKVHALGGHRPFVLLDPPYDWQAGYSETKAPAGCEGCEAYQQQRVKVKGRRRLKNLTYCHYCHTCTEYRKSIQGDAYVMQLWTWRRKRNCDMLADGKDLFHPTRKENGGRVGVRVALSYQVTE
jgi:hypothetical protein